MAIYLLYGEETYLLKNYLKKIKKEHNELLPGINYILLDDSNVSGLISELETPAFGFEKKLIIAKNTGLLKKEKKTATKGKTEKKKSDKKLQLNEIIAEYLEVNTEQIKDVVDLVFVEQEVDKNSLFQTIEKVGQIKEYGVLKLPEIISHLKKVCSLYKVEISDDTAKYLVECSGTNMQDLMNEIRKLIEYTGEGNKISKEDIDMLCTKQIQAVIFDLTDNLGKKETKKALEVYNGLIHNKEPIQKILITLYNHFKKLYIIKMAEKYRQDAAQAMNLKPNQMFLVGKYKAQSKYFKEEELRIILEELINLDSNSKIGLISLDIGLESVLCRYCS